MLFTPCIFIGKIVLFAFSTKVRMLVCRKIIIQIKIFFGVVRGIGEVVPTFIKIIKVLNVVLL